jgi:prefoldin subunit 5
MSASTDRQERISQLTDTRRKLAEHIEKVSRELAEKTLTLELIDAQLHHLRNPPAKVSRHEPGYREDGK